MQIRAPQPDEAVSICTVLRRSITELCIADHKNDPSLLSQWLANKTPEHIANWMANADNHFVVAVEGGAVIGVGAVTKAGAIMLNYVAPDARFRGASKAIVAQLEHIARELGNRVCTLESTETARQFYISVGFAPDGEPGIAFGLPSYPMIKSLID